MITVMFVCHGNICRSTMAEFVFKDMVVKKGYKDKIIVHSTGTASSTEENGSPVYPGTRQKLAEVGISCKGKISCQVTREHCDKADYILVMDKNNLRNLQKYLDDDSRPKVRRLLEVAGRGGDIADPWYTGNFDDTYQDVLVGCTALLEEIEKSGEV